MPQLTPRSDIQTQMFSCGTSSERSFQSLRYSRKASSFPSVSDSPNQEPIQFPMAHFASRLCNEVRCIEANKIHKTKPIQIPNELQNDKPLAFTPALLRYSMKKRSNCTPSYLNKYIAKIGGVCEKVPEVPLYLLSI